MTESPVSGIRELIGLAQDPSQQSRSKLLAIISELHFGADVALTNGDKAVMVDIIRELILGVEKSVRRALAERLAEFIEVPRELIVLLANDEIEVAFPLLAKSEILQDPDLIEIIRQRTMEHQLVIAARPQVSETVSDELVLTENETVIARLLSNHGAQFSDATLAHLVRQSEHIVSYQEPLVHRPDLTPELARKLCLWVASALRDEILDIFNIDPDTLNDAVEDAIRNETEPACRKGEFQNDPNDNENKVAHLIALLDAGEISRFFGTFVKYTGLQLTLVRRLMFERDGMGLSIACKELGMDKDSFAKIFLLCHKGRLGDKKVEERELATALSFFENTSSRSANKLMDCWRSNPKSFDALQRLDALPGH